MAEMMLYVVTVSLAVYGLSCLIRLIWSHIIRANHSSDNVLLVTLKNGSAEFDLRHSTSLAKNCGIDRIVAVDGGVDSETNMIAKMYANNQPMVEICDINDKVSKIIH